MVRQAMAVVLSGTIVLAGCGSTPLPTLNPAPAVITPTTSAKVIKHIVVIFPENVSFDHYFGTYPNAANLASDATKFTAATGTPTNISNYVTNPALVTGNPNLNPTNGAGASGPFRLSAAEAGTADQNHNYGPEQTAFDGGKMDMFPLSVGTADTSALATATGASALAQTAGLTMGYYDGNTVTALWNYAQHYAMNDHSFGTTFGASTQGAINLISGQTNGAVVVLPSAASGVIADGQGGNTLIGDEDPYNDICSSTTATVQMTGKNIGDLLNAAGVTWGFFEQGFNTMTTNANGTSGCSRTTTANVATFTPKVDYIAHHEPFQYYASTQNPSHARPTATIGTSDAANHQYDTSDFDTALAAGVLPAVSFLKPAGYQDAHAGYSDPLDEQAFLVREINSIEQSSFWSSTAIIVAYDDSDGWYDHMNNFVNGSMTSADSLNGAGVCISATAAAAALGGVTSNGKPVGGRCGYGPRLPLLVISPWAQKNYIDNTVTDQTSVLRFIEDTFLSGQRIGGGSFDSIAGPINNMFNFSNGAVIPNPTPVILNANGTCSSGC